METRAFGPVNSLVSVIGQGSWNIDIGERSRAIAALRRDLDLGMNHIDTAEMYGAGEAEKMIGRAILGRRDEVFIVSKVLPSHASRSGTIAACENSLIRLGTDRLDCYLLHWRGEYPLEETIAGFEDLQRDGKILSWGVSNFDVDDLNEVVSIAGEGSFACNQVLYHLRERAIEHAVLPWCEEHGVAVVGYSPFGHSGSFPDPHTAQGRVLNQIAAARNATPRQVALRFLVRRPSLFTIPKASSPEHVTENARAENLRLTEDELERIDKAFPLNPHYRGLPIL
jgi:diketogulonate reductase-like aldo/keto reductase